MTTVKDVQSALIALGYDCIAVDGIVEVRTVAAIKKFQKDNHLGVVTRGKLEEVLNR